MQVLEWKDLEALSPKPDCLVQSFGSAVLGSTFQASGLRQIHIYHLITPRSI